MGFKIAGRTSLLLLAAALFLSSTAARGADSGPLDFYKLPPNTTPCRVFDSRIDTPPGPFAGETSHSIQVTGVCGVPATAMAVAFNVTVADPTADGHAVVYAGAVEPLTSTVNFPAGRTRANNAIVDLAPDGTVTVTVHTAGAGSAHVILDVSGYFQNGGPVLTAGGGNPTFIEDGPPVVVDPALGISDPFSPTISSATVTITNPQDGAAEILAATSCPGLTVTPGLNSLSITGVQPTAIYETCLRSVFYSNSSQNPGTTPRVISFVADNGVGVSNTVTTTVNVQAVDDAPVAVNDAATVAEDSGANAIPVLTNDTDVDAGPLLITAVQTPSAFGGTVLITGGGTGLTYAPAADYCNTPPGTTLDTFTYTITGGSTATVTMTVTCVDDNPVAVNDAATVTEDSGANAIPVLTNDTDVDAGPLLITAVQTPSAFGGTVLITGGGTGLTYAPAANYCNTPPGTTLDTFTYTITGGSTATVTMTVTCVDDNPVAVNDTATVAEDSGANAIPVLTNDTDVDAGPLLITAVQTPSAFGGTVLITGGGTGLTYAPAADYCNTPPGTTLDTFTYTITGGSTATVTMTVTCVDDNPVAVNDAASVTEDSGANAIPVLTNDTDVDAGPMLITAVQTPSAFGGTVLITGGGTGLTYAPAANYCNTPPGTTLDTFTYTITGGSTATVTMTVTCVDDTPVAAADAATVNEDSGANTINVLANDVDLDGGLMTVTAVQNPSVQGGTVLITNGGLDLTYAPAANYCNTPPGTTLDTFTYTLNGGSTATVTVSVTCINDAPVVDLDADDDKGTGGSNFAITFTEGDAPKLLEDPDNPLGATITDVDSPTLTTLTVTLTNLLDAGDEVLDANVSLFPNISKNYDTTTPGVGVLTLSTVTPQPIADFQAVLRTVTYLNSSQAPNTTARIVHFVANDGAANSNTAVSTVTLLAVDDSPVAVNDVATVGEDSGANAVPVLANDTDVDGGTKLVTAVQSPSAFGGTVLITGGGTGLTYAPAANYCNTPPGTTLDTFTYTLNGGSTATVTVTVNCVDDNPTAVADAATVAEDSGANAIPVLTNDTDPDGGTKLVTAVQSPSVFGGTVLITGGGTGLTYAPAANYCNTPPGTTLDTFTYTITGGSTATVTVTVTCVDDDPVAVADSATVVEDSVANAIPVLTNDTDIDGGPKLVTAVQSPSTFSGTVSITGGGTGLTYTPAANYCNTPPGTTLDTFTYTITGGSTATVTVAVTCVDDPPVAVADSATVNEDSGANSIPVLTNDTDVDGGPKLVTAVQTPSTFGGTVLITGGGTGLTYAPAANYCNTPPGTTLDTFTYTITGGSTATVTVTVICINDAPTITTPITYTTPGNTQLHVAGATLPGVASWADPLGILDAAKSNPGDIDGPVAPTAVAASGTSVNGGSYTINTNGSFTYVPPVGFTGTDSFPFQVTDTVTPTNGTVNVTVGQRVWYIHDVINGNNAAGGDGRSSNAFDSIAAFNAATTNNGDIIFVFEGNTATTPHSGGITLRDGQKLWGQGIALNVPGFATPLANATNRARIRTTTASTDVVSVPATAGNRSNIEIRGLDLEATGATSNAIDVTASGGNAVGVTISNDNIRGATAEGIDLNSGSTAAFSATVQNNTVTATGNGIDTRVTAAGIATVTASNNTISSSANAFDARTQAGASALRVSFDNSTVTAGGIGILVDGSAAGITTITGFVNNVVSGNTVGSGISITSATFDQTAGSPYDQVSGGIAMVGASGNGVGGSGIILSNVSGDLLFTDFDIVSEGGGALVITGTGAVNVGAATGTRVVVTANAATVEATGGPAVSVTNATVDLQLLNLKSTTPSTGVSLTNVSDGTTNAVFSAVLGSSNSITANAGASGPAFNVSGGNAAISYSGTITNNSTAARAVSITTWSGDDAGDDLTLSGAITENGAGILVNGNGGSRSITFSGGMAIATTAGEGFAATSNTNTGGLHVTGTNTISSTSATALRVTNTTIGNSDLTFRSISSGNNTAAADPVNGIILNTTGALGGLKVTGTGASGQGGNGTGGLIQNTTSHGISLATTREPAFANVTINNTAGSGINGAAVTDFTFDNGTITNSGTGGGVDTANIAFGAISSGVNNLNGVVVITDSLLNTARYHGIDIYNEAGTISSITVTGNSLTSSTGVANSQGSGIRVQANGSAGSASVITTGTFSNNTVTNFPMGAGILVQGGNAALGPPAGLGDPTSGANMITISGNAIAGSGATANVDALGSNAIQTAMTGTGNAKFFINGNGTVGVPLRNFLGIGISCSGGNLAVIECSVSNNVIDATANIASSSGMAVGSQLGVGQNGSITALIENNSISGMEGNGILAGVSNSGNTGNFTIRGNTVGNPTGGVRPGIRVESGSASGDTTLCLDMHDNASGASGGHAGLGIRKQGSVATTNDFGIVGLVPSPATCGQAEDRVSSLNPGTNPGTVTTGSDCDGNPGSKTLAISGSNYVSCTVVLP